MYICDERSGCIAVYEAPPRVCLAMPMGAFVYFQGGKRNPGGWWDVPAWRVREAQIVCGWLNSPVPLVRLIGRIYAALHMAGIRH